MNGADILEAMGAFRESIETRFGRDAEDAHEEEEEGPEGGDNDPAAEAEEKSE